MNCTQCQQPLAPGAAFCSACGTPLPAGAVAGSDAPGEKKSKGPMWLLIGIGCFGAFIVFGGIIAAIAIPNLLSAVQRGKQKRTMGDIKTLASALEAFNTDQGHYPPGASLADACATLVPDYLPSCIEKDGWSTPEQPRRLGYASWGGAPEGCAAGGGAPDNPGAPCGPAHYGLASAGKDGRFEHRNFGEYGGADTTSFAADIVLIDGQFVQQPLGKQGNGSTGDEYDAPPGPAPESNDAPPDEMPPAEPAPEASGNPA